MKKYIGTFSELYPQYKNRYIVVHAKSMRDAITLFHHKYPEAGRIYPTGLLEVGLYSDGCYDEIYQDKEEK